MVNAIKPQIIPNLFVSIIYLAEDGSSCLLIPALLNFLYMFNNISVMDSISRFNALSGTGEVIITKIYLADKLTIFYA